MSEARTETGSRRPPPLRKRIDAARQASFSADGLSDGAPSGVRAFSGAIDGVVGELWRDAGDPQDVALVATGGWGRREVAPYSDLDFVLLSGRRRDLQELADKLLYPLWDAGLTVGHSVATPAEAARLARDDLATATSMLDARLVAGDGELADDLRGRTLGAIAPHGNANEFVARLTDELERRHRKFGASIYLLEPNLKQGIGALRDLDTIAWIARARFQVDSLRELVPAGQLSPRQVGRVLRARAFHLELRALLQLVAGRRTDQLTFEIQEQIAPMVVPETSLPVPREGVEPAVRPAVEELMRRYYLHARAVVSVVERFAAAARVPVRKRPRIARVDSTLLLFNGKLAVKDPAIFDQRPAEMVRIFRVACDLDVSIYAHTKDLIEDRLAEGRLSLAGDPRASRLLLDALIDSRDRRQPSLLEQMHQVGLLGELLPEFAPCTCRVQHDLYHVYTVDQHQLKTVAMLKRAFRGEERDIGGHIPAALGAIERPEVLYLGTLLHDVGKPLGSGHSEKGARLAGIIARRLGVTGDDALSVEFLVRQHLTMSHLSQRRDLSDPAVISRFASIVQTPERLAMLYLLTRCDTAMTAPGNLSEWKDQLLGELYDKTAKFLLGTPSMPLASQADQAERVRQHTVERLRRRIESEHGEGDGTGELDSLVAFVDSLDDSFVTQLSSGQLLRQYRLARKREASDSDLAMSVACFPLKGHSELAVIAQDSPGILADITGALAASRVDILEAAIGTGLPSQPGDPPLVVDLFHVRDLFGKAIPKEDPRWDKLEADLLHLMQHERSGERAHSLIEKRRGSKLSPRVTPAVDTSIVVDNDASADYSVIEVMTKDRPGVLHAITRCMAENGLDIHLSKINTEGERVTDAFYVADARAATGGDRKLRGERLGEIRAALERALAAVAE